MVLHKADTIRPLNLPPLKERALRSIDIDNYAVEYLVTIITDTKGKRGTSIITTQHREGDGYV